MYPRFGKRALDLALTIPALIVLSPLMGCAALLVRLSLGPPVLFRQPRPGLHGQLFTIYKFRTMTERRDANGILLPDAQRLTRVGRFLRSTSLDELPELFNVLTGAMSVVGPRPLLARYLERYSPQQMRRHDAKPGITGLAQIGGRNALTWDEKFALDLRYVQELSLTLDLRIIGLTLVKIARREGISQPGSATAEEFKGTP